MSESPTPLSFTFTVPGNVRPKGRPRLSFKDGVRRAWIPRANTDYQNVVRQAALQALGPNAPLEGAVRVDVTMWRQPPARASKAELAKMLSGQLVPISRPDIDNVLKAVSDALTGAVIRDDAQISDLIGRKRYGSEARIDVSVSQVGVATEETGVSEGGEGVLVRRTSRGAAAI